MFKIYANFCRWLDLNRCPLVSEATALPTEPHHYPTTTTYSYTCHTHNTLGHPIESKIRYANYSILICCSNLLSTNHWAMDLKIYKKNLPITKRFCLSKPLISSSSVSFFDRILIQWWSHHSKQCYKLYRYCYFVAAQCYKVLVL